LLKLLQGEGNYSNSLSITEKYVKVWYLWRKAQ